VTSPPRTAPASTSSASDRRKVGAQVVAGSAVAAGITAAGVAAAGVAAVPVVIGAAVAAPIYAAIHLSVHAFRKRKRAAEAPVDQDAETLAALDAFIADTEDRVPPIVEARILRISETVRQTIPRLDQLPAGSAQAHAVVRTATSYLPEAVASYLRLPRDFADRRAVSGSKTSLAILCDQLDLLASKMDDLFDAACRADADALIAHGRFLAEKFGSGTLAIDPEKR
jgi:hypothetical protein